MSHHERQLSPTEQVACKFKKHEKMWQRQYPDVELTYLENSFKEIHHSNCNTHANYFIYGTKNNHFVPLTSCIDLEDQDVINREQVHQARLAAAKALLTNRVDRVTIFYGDSDNVVTNSRNAPLDGNAEHQYPQYPKLHQLPKKNYPEPLPGTYDWDPLTNEERLDILAEAIPILQMEKKQTKQTKHEFNCTRRSSRKLKRQLRTQRVEKQKARQQNIVANEEISAPIAKLPKNYDRNWRAQLPEYVKNPTEFYRQHTAARHYGASTPDYYPDKGENNHPDYLREVTIDAGTYKKRAYLLNEADSHGFRIIQEQQFDGSFSEGQVHTSRILNTLLPENRTYIDRKDPNAGYFPERVVKEEPPILINLPLCLPIISEVAQLEIDHN